MTKDAFLGIIRRVLSLVKDTFVILKAKQFIKCTCFRKRFAYSSFQKQALGLHDSPLKDLGRANPAKAKQFAFAPIAQRIEHGFSKPGM